MRHRKIRTLPAFGTLLIWLSVSAGTPLSSDPQRADDLQAQVQELYNAGKYSETISAALELLNIQERTLGPEHADTVTTVAVLGHFYTIVGDYEKAGPLYQRALKAREKALGPEHPDTARSLDNLANLYKKMGDYAKAEPLYQRALKIYEKKLGTEHPDTARIINNLGEIYSDLGRWDKAESLYQRALQIREKTRGLEHPDTAATLHGLAAIYEQTGDSAKAERFYQRALEIREKTLGPEHPDTAETVNSLAQFYKHKRDYRKAEPLYQRALEISEKLLGAEHPNIAPNLYRLGMLYEDMGDYAKAEPLFERVVKIRQKAFGPENPDSKDALANLVALHNEMARGGKAESLYDRARKIAELDRQREQLSNAGKYAEAIPLAQQALDLCEKAVGPDNTETAVSLNNLASLYRQIRDYAKAEPLYERALNIIEKAHGAEHPDTANSLENLAKLNHEMNNYAKAEPLYERALKIREKVFGAEDAETAATVAALGNLYKDMHNYAKAESLYQRTEQFCEKVLGPNHRLTQMSVDKLAGLYQEIGDYAKAEPLLRRILKTDDKNPETASSLSNLGFIYQHMGDYAKAEELFQHALKIREKVLGPEHVDTAKILRNLAMLYVDIGDYTKAEPLWRRALQIEDKNGLPHPLTSVSQLVGINIGLGDYAGAEVILRRALAIAEDDFPPNHPQIATALSDLATLNHIMGKYETAKPLFQRAIKIEEATLGSERPENDIYLASSFFETAQPQEALRLAIRARRVEEKTLANIFSFTSERQRLLVQRKLHYYSDLLASLGDAPQIAESVLRQKGVVLDSLLEDRLMAEVSEDPRQHGSVVDLRGMKQRLMRLLLEAPSDLSESAIKEREAEKQELSHRVEELEATLARRVAAIGNTRRALSVTVPQVQAALRNEETLTELLRYEHYLGKNKFEARYGAIVLGHSGEPKWIQLGKATDIENHVALYQKSVRSGEDEASRERQEATLESVLRALHDQVWSPIEKTLPADTKTIILSPDGELNFLSFATFLGPDDKFLAEKYCIRYVASGRDLLQQAKGCRNQDTFIFANPDFRRLAETNVSTNPATSVALRSTEMSDLRGISLPPLPGTAAEATDLKKQEDLLHHDVDVFVEAKATEAQLRNVRSPRILHLATHGFFLPEVELGTAIDPLTRNEKIPNAKLINPMHRSGLALAGAQSTFEAWSRGEVPPTENDGIVTAEEVGALNLEGTWLVVLSACETGLGESRRGEGVLGLRRGFTQAGAQNLLMTLWPVSDEVTKRMMLDFYERAEKSLNAAQSLAETQRDWLVELRKRYGLFRAINLAGPFIMSCHGSAVSAGEGPTRTK